MPFNFFEYHAEKAIENEQLKAIHNWQLEKIDIDENGVASNAARKAIAEVLESLPLDNHSRYEMTRFEQAISELHLEYSQVDLIVGLIKKYRETRLFAQLHWIGQHGKLNPAWGDIFMDVPESNEDGNSK